MPDIVINKDLVSAKIPDWQVNDTSGKPIGAVDHIARQNFIHILGDMTNNYLYAVAGVPAGFLAASTWYDLVVFPNSVASYQPISFEVKFQMNLNNSTPISAHFEVSGAASTFAISLLHQTGWSSGTGSELLANARTTLASDNSWHFQIQTGGNSHISNSPATAQLIWSSSAVPYAQSTSAPTNTILKPKLVIAASTITPGTTLTMALNNGGAGTSKAFIFACISTNSASQTSFV